MAFVKATINFKPASVGTGIKCSLRKGKASAATITFSINASVAKQANIGDGDGIEVMIGEGEHHGLIRLRKNNSAADTKAEHRTTGKGAFFLIKLGHQPAFVDRSEPSAWCKWEKVEDGFIEILLPKWADETKPGRKTVFGTAKPADGCTNIKTAHTNINTKPLAAQPKKSVTANLMGDPAPGRREMLQKMGEMKG
jgi:hypothetical protein